jgi:hypothetical protein
MEKQPQKKDSAVTAAIITTIGGIITTLIAVLIAPIVIAKFTATPTPVPTLGIPIAIPVATNNPTNENPSFVYRVQVIDQDTSQPLPLTMVTIEVNGQTPIVGTTDSNGIAQFIITSNYVGQPASIGVNTTGYGIYIQNMELTSDKLPSALLLTKIQNTETSILLPQPQQTRWGPVDGYDAGICLNTCTQFISWEELKSEVEQKLLPQVAVIPINCTIKINDTGGKKDWIVEIIDPSGTVIGNVWFGPDPLNSWAYDGLVRVGTPVNPVSVWATFERYSDGSYRLK